MARRFDRWSMGSSFSDCHHLDDTLMVFRHTRLNGSGKAIVDARVLGTNSGTPARGPLGHPGGPVGGRSILGGGPRRPVKGRCSNLGRVVGTERQAFPVNDGCGGVAEGCSSGDPEIAGCRRRAKYGPSSLGCHPFEGITKDLRLPAHVVGPHTVDAEPGPLDES